MHRTSVLKRVGPSPQAARAPGETEPLLQVATVYQDTLTFHWATELWERVGKLISGQGVCHQTWKISGLMEPGVFVESVRAAAAADVLVISVRDAGELPVNLYVWIDAWMPRRVGRAGALVALIGVSPQPDTQSGRAYAYLEAVARRTRLDFLPRERKLPEAPFALSIPPKFTQGRLISGPLSSCRASLNLSTSCL